MRRLRCQVCAAAVAVAASAAGASAASAATLFVNGSTGSPTNSCLVATSACKTIAEAVKKAEVIPDATTIDIAAGTYAETVALVQDSDSGLTLDGAGSGLAGTVIQAPSGAGVVATEPNEGPTTLENLRVLVPNGDTSPALVFSKTPYVLDNVTVSMEDAASTAAAIIAEATTGSMHGVEVSGAWEGETLIAEGSTTITSSRLISHATDMLLVSGAPGDGHVDLIRDSTLQASSTASAVNVLASDVDVTIDSSLLLGGNPYGVEWVKGESPALATALTVSASTIDAGVLGVEDPSSVADIFAASEGPTGVPASVRVVGSILLDHLAAEHSGTGDPLTISCAYSDVPSQVQAETSLHGAIECASATNGNTYSTPASLFASPGLSYELNPSSSAIDSVPAGAISLPFGLTPSETDLAGNPRIVDGNGDCVAVQDKGALELQGHSAPCPSPPPITPVVLTPASSKPLAGIVSTLSISPSTFLAAPSGATISALAATVKNYGAKISYRDSQIATTTLTVLRETSGRKQGKSCKKPSKANKHGKRCTILTALGSFSHVDVAGANSLHFSGRIKGKKLPAGSYELQAIAHDAAGNGVAVEKSFKVEA